MINLGTDDFSTAVHPGEPWTPDSLAAAYGDFIQKLRTRFGADTTVVAVGAGASRVRYWAHDDRLIADRLTSFLAGLPTGW